MNKPKIFATCKAGCLWETVHRDELLSSATLVEKFLTDGAVNTSPFLRYKIYSDFVEKNTETFAMTDNTYSVKEDTVTVVDDLIYFVAYNSENSNLYLRAYDTVTRSLTDLLVYLSDYANGFMYAVGKKLYIKAKTSYSYDTVSGQLNDIQTLPNGFCCVVGNKAYFVKSATGSNNREIYTYDADGTAGDTLFTLKFAPENFVVVGKKIYIYGESYKYVYDTETRLLSPLFNDYVTNGQAAIGGKIYHVKNSLGVVTEYDTNDNGFAYNPLPSLSEEDDVYWRNFVSVGNTVYAIDRRLATAKTQAFTFDGYKSRVAFAYTDNGAPCKAYFPINEANKYVDHFYFEITHISLNETATEVTIAYDVNGRKNILVVAGKNIDFAEECLTISEANKVFAINVDASIKCETPQKGVDYWTEEDKSEIKDYVDEAILGGEW